MGVIKDELVEVQERYGDERRTEILYDVSELSLEDLIAEEDMVVTLSHQGYAKRTPLDEYRAQRRGGRGKRGMGTKDEDFVTDMFVASTHTNILIFTSIGKLYMLRTHELPLGSRTTKGSHVANLLPLQEDETVQTILASDDFYEDKFVVFATRNGIIKKTELIAYQNVHSGGIIALNIKEGDELVSVRLSEGDDEILMVSKNGQSIRFHESDARPMGRTATGVIGMRFKDEDELVGMEVLPDERDDALTILTITENGYGKRTIIDEYPQQSRGGKGVITMKVNDRNGRLVGTRLVHDDDQLMLITDQGQILRTRVGEISTYGRNTQGVKVMVTDDSEKVVSMARLAETDEEDEELEEGLEGAEFDAQEVDGETVDDETPNAEEVQEDLDEDEEE